MVGRSLAAAVLLAALALYGGLLDRLRRFERAAGAGGPPWWFGYARDGVNLLGALALFVGFVIAGLGGPAALVLGTALTFIAYVTDALLGKQLSIVHARLITLGATGLLALAAIAAADPLADWLRGVLAALLPR
jgi:hypothetical protein